MLNVMRALSRCAAARWLAIGADESFDASANREAWANALLAGTREEAVKHLEHAAKIARRHSDSVAEDECLALLNGAR